MFGFYKKAFQGNCMHYLINKLWFIHTAQDLDWCKIFENSLMPRNTPQSFSKIPPWTVTVSFLQNSNSQGQGKHNNYYQGLTCIPNPDLKPFSYPHPKNNFSAVKQKSPLKTPVTSPVRQIFCKITCKKGGISWYQGVFENFTLVLILCGVNKP